MGTDQGFFDADIGIRGRVTNFCDFSGEFKGGKVLCSSGLFGGWYVLVALICNSTLGFAYKITRWGGKGHTGHTALYQQAALLALS